MAASQKSIVIGVVLIVAVFASVSLSQAIVTTGWITGSAPDWDQPYDYGPPATVGPGGWPVPPAPAPWAAWCAPTSASNLVGYWEDGRGIAISDGFVFGATANYGVGADWHDYNLDGSVNRLGKAAALPTAPGPPADLGWYMDTNNGGTNLRGNGAHAGTYIKDMADAVGDYLSVWGTGWMAKTEGQTGPIPPVAYTTDPINYPAAPACHSGLGLCPNPAGD